MSKTWPINFGKWKWRHIRSLSWSFHLSLGVPSPPARRIKRYSTFQNVSFAFYSHVEKSENSTYADHVLCAEANLFSSAVTFDGLCHPCCARLCPAIHLSNLGKMSIIFRPRSFPLAEFEFSVVSSQCSTNHGIS